MSKFFKFFLHLAVIAMMPNNIGCSPSCGGQKNLVVDFKNSVEITPKFTASPPTLRVSVNLKDGFHAYAQGESIGIPVRLEILKKNGWAAAGPAAVPLGSIEDMGDLGRSVVLKDDFTIEVELKGGRGKGEAILHLQVCSKNACDRPRQHKIVF